MLTPVEMSSLGVNRFQDSDRALEQADEDAFCTRLRNYGASFWELPPRWPEHVNWCEEMDGCVKPKKEVRLEVGFPSSGGVWMLDTSQGWDKLPPKAAGLGNALKMDERCEVIKDLGGRFCENVQECPEMAALLGM
ncbi:fungal specific transcription factor protein [Rutstroemia sp. NJR-2017a BBW]|nr:fungal specific transcription factor protein [Rutstroemia sp. NJR-2017a BBW]